MKIKSLNDFSTFMKGIEDCPTIDYVEQFLIEKCEMDFKYKVASKELYDAYTLWCTKQPCVLPISHKSFSSSLARAGAVAEMHADGRWWLGLRLKKDE